MMSAKKIAIHMPTPPSHHGGGAEKVMMRIAAGLAERGHAVDFVINRAQSAAWSGLSPAVKPVDLGVHRYATLPGLIRYIRAERPDTLLTSGKSANIASLLAKRFFGPEFRLVLHISNSVSGVYEIGGPREKVAITLSKALMPAADSIVTLNQDMERDVKSVVPKAADRVRTIYDPHDITAIRTASQEPIDHPWFSADRAFSTVLSVGRLHYKKDLPTLLRAIALVFERRAVRLVLLGEGPELSRLKRLSEELGIAEIVDFAGFKANPYPYMARADVFALSSLVEGLVGVLIEALACGASVASTDCTFGPAEILQKGRLGRLSPVGDAPALAESILRALDNPTPREILTEGARRFDVEKVIGEYEELCDLV